MALDAALLALTAGELKNTLLDAKIDKIFEPTRDEVLLTLRTRTDTFKLLLSARSGSSRLSGGPGMSLTIRSSTSPMFSPVLALMRGASSAGMPITSSISWATRSGSAAGRSILLITGRISRSCSMAR